MTKKSSAPPSTAQARRSATFAKTLERKAREREAQYQREHKEFLKKQTAYFKERDKELTKLLKNVRGKGIYEPKGNALTPYRRKRLAEVKAQFGQYLDPNENFFLPAKGAARERIIERAKSLEMATTKKGLFFPKANYKTARLKYDRKHDEFIVNRKGKVKHGEKAGRIYQSNIPLASLDALDHERDRIRAMAASLGPLEPNERLVFKVMENSNEGFSHAVFGNVELLLRYLENYKKKQASKVNFFRHIEVEKSGTKEWFAAHNHNERKPRSRGRFNTRRSK